MNQFYLQKEEKKEDKKEKESDKKDDKRDSKKELISKQGIAALAVAVIAIGEETGTEMCTRIFGQLVSSSVFTGVILKSKSYSKSNGV